MEKKRFKKELQIILEKYEFVCNKKNYYCDNDKYIFMINPQKSQNSEQFYVNYGIAVKEIHKDFITPDISECDLMGRFDCRIGDQVAFSYDLEEIDESNLEINIVRNIETIIQPIKNDGIEECFRLFPQARCTMKLVLRKYLDL